MRSWEGESGVEVFVIGRVAAISFRQAEACSRDQDLETWSGIYNTELGFITLVRDFEHWTGVGTLHWNWEDNIDGGDWLERGLFIGDE